MRNVSIMAHAMIISGLLCASATPALSASKKDRAQAAIAEARGKIDAANKVGVSGDVPRLQAEAQAALRIAQEELARGHKDRAIAAAMHASEVADTALGVAQKNREANEQAQRANAEAAAAAAQQQAADANARAAASAADAAAARAAPPVVIAPAPTPAPTTTVTTETVKTSSATKAATTARPATRKRTVHRTVRKAPARTSHAVTEKTTTTVTTTPQ